MSDDWDLIQELFEKGLDRNGDERRRLLDQYCPDRDDLHLELWELWSHDESTSDFGVIRSLAKDLIAASSPPQPENAWYASMIGQRISHYRLEKELGRGGMGAVYLGIREDDELHMKVAVKLMRREMATPGIQKRFLRERQLLATLRHRNIGMLFDAGTTDEGFPYLIMEYIEGEHIDAWCARHRPSPIVVSGLIRDIASSLGAAHSAGVIHRDIKPQNIMVTAAGEVKVLDFGIARHLDQAEESLEVPLTPAYAAPEQLLGQKLNEACDIYALGLVFLQLLTGRPPGRSGIEPLEMVARLMAHGRIQRNGDTLTGEGDLSPASKPIHTNGYETREMTGRYNTRKLVEPDEKLPESLGFVLRRCLAVDLRQRYRRTDALIADLDRVMISPTPDGREQPKPKKVYDALFWYHPDDYEAVSQLAGYLEEEAELRVEFSAGLYTQPEESLLALDQLLALSRSCLICVGPDLTNPWTRSPAQSDNLAFRASELRLLPLLLPGATLPDSEDRLPAYLQGHSWFRFEEGWHAADREELAEEIRGNRSQQMRPRPTGICPYRGVQPFRESDRHLFFGRESTVQQVYDQLEAHAFAVVSGPSSCGKSSLVHAGIVPLLRAAGASVALISSSRKPFEELALSFHGLYRDAEKMRATESLVTQLHASATGLSSIVAELSNALDDKLYLVLDQFEDLLSQDTETERDALITALSRMVKNLGDRVSVLVTMRRECEEKLSPYPELKEHFRAHTIIVPPVSAETLMRVIASPGRHAGLVMDNGLAERLLRDVAEAPGVLSLLEHTLWALYQAHDQGRLTHAAYDNMGGVGGALIARAEDDHATLAEDDREALRKLLVFCMTDPGEGRPDAPRRASYAELKKVGGDRGERLIQRWIRLRLFIADHDKAGGVTVSHKALIGDWQRLATWMEHDRETVRLMARLRRDASAWERSGRLESLLPQKPALLRIRDLADRGDLYLSPTERAFVSARAARAKRRRRLRLLAGVPVFALIALATLMFLRVDRHRQSAETALNITRQQNQRLGHHLAAMYTLEAEKALQQRQTNHAWVYTAAALDTEALSRPIRDSLLGHLVHPTMVDGNRLLWTSPVDPGARCASFSFDGNLLALAGMDHTIRLVDLNHGGPAGLFIGHTASISRLAFRPGHGQDPLLVSGSEDSKVMLWRVEPAPWSAFHPQATLEHDDVLMDLAFSPDGNILATATQNGMVRFWHIEDGDAYGLQTTPSGSWPVRDGKLSKIAFSSSHLLAAAFRDGTIHIGLPDKGPVSTLDGMSGSVTDLLSAGERWISAHEHGTIIIWNADGSRHHTIETSPDHEPGGMAVIDDTTLVFPDQGGKLAIWDIQSGKKRRDLVRPRDMLPSIGSAEPVVNRAGSLMWETGPNPVLWGPCQKRGCRSSPGTYRRCHRSCIFRRSSTGLGVQRSYRPVMGSGDGKNGEGPARS